MKKILKNKKGFTLIELIVVIAIIAILAAIAIPTFSGVLESSKTANVESIARNAYTLAKIELLECEIESSTLSIDEATVFAEAGVDTSTYTLCDIVYDDSTGTVTSVYVLIDGYEATYDGTSMSAGKVAN